MAKPADHRQNHWAWPLTRWPALLVLAVLVTGCTITPDREQAPASASEVLYSLDAQGDTLLARHAPLIRIEEGTRDYNKIGTVSARYDEKGKEEIYVDTATPTLYTEQRSFQGRHGRYTNLIYRMHFREVPFSLWPFSLTYGRNVGLLVIVTLNEAEKPVLLTTVHSCGCYLAIVPTDQLIDSALPPDWRHDSQIVFGETLTGRLHLANKAGAKIIIDLRGGSHRVHEISALAAANLPPDRPPLRAPMLPIRALRELPLGDGVTSMFATEGRRKGYVKGSSKPFEAAFMSWWALDLNVGVDKDYGAADDTGTIFYTSLKPWQRRASDMWPFEDFLAFWGWSL